MADNAQKTILVKKADGTSVRMSLLEALKERKKEDIPTDAGEFVAPDYSFPDRIFQEIPDPEKELKDVNLEAVPTLQEVKTLEAAPSKKDNQELAKDGEVSKKMETTSTEKNEIKAEERQKKEEKKINLPAKPAEHSLSTTAPVKKIFIGEAMAKIVPQSPEHLMIDKNVAAAKQEQPKQKSNIKKENQFASNAGERKKVETIEPEKKSAPANLKREDFVSPLEESFDHQPENHKMPVLPAKKSGLLDKILSKLSFSIPRDLTSRAESLASSFVKEVRTKDQVRVYVIREPEKGGLGLDETQADEFMKALAEIKNFSQDKNADKPTNLRNIELADSRMEPKEKTMPVKRNLPDGEVSRKMHDVVLPEKKENQTVSPVEELRIYNLTEFRRLANNAGEAKEMVLEKFNILKEDSYLMYLEGCRAWRENPLNKMYKEIITKAITQKKTIENILINDPSGMTMDELRAIMDINREIT